MTTMAASAECIAGGGRPRGHRHPSGQGGLSRSRGVTKLDLINYYLAVADGALRGVAGRPMILKRFVKGIDAGGDLPEAGTREAARTGSTSPNSSTRPGTSAKEAVLHDAAGLVWAVNLGCVDLNPHPVRADDLDHPDELRVDLDPMPGVDVAADRRRRAGRPRSARGPRADRVAEDVGVARLPHLRAHRTALAVPAGAAGRRDGRPRSRAPRAGAGDQPVVEGGTRGRVRRLQPERQGPHGRLGVLGALAARRPGVDAAALGRGARLPARGSSPWRRCPRGSPRSATRGRAWTTRSAGSTGCCELAEELGPAGEGAARERDDESRCR